MFADKDDNTPKEPKECKSSCNSSGKTNYNYGENLCFESPCPEDKYTKSGEPNICYNSCIEIPERKNIYESSTGNICYTKDDIEAQNCLFYYSKDDGTGIMKCIPSSFNFNLQTRRI